MDLVFKAKSWWKDWWKGEWELWYGERVVASLIMKNWTYSLTEVTIGETKWEIGYSGWMGNRFFVRDTSGNTIAKAVARSRWSTDMDIEIEEKKYALLTNWWQTRFYAVDESGAEVVSLKPRWWSGSAEVSNIRSPEDKTALLLTCILFYQYKIVEMNGTAAAAAAGGTVVVSSS